MRVMVWFIAAGSSSFEPVFLDVKSNVPSTYELGPPVEAQSRWAFFGHTLLGLTSVTRQLSS